MNLTKLEKGIIIFLVVGGILAAGIFFFVMPSYEKIGKAENALKAAQTKEQEIQTKLQTKETIEQNIADAKVEARQYEKFFYPDLTTYEAVEITLAHLKKCNMDTDSIGVTSEGAQGLTLVTYAQPQVIYGLKEMSNAARGADENALLEGEFMDGGKKYSIALANIYSVSIMDAETGEEVSPSKYTNTMKTAYKEAICRFVSSSGMAESVGVTTVTFDAKGTYEDYINFVNYIYKIDRATYMKDVTIPVTMTEIEEKQAGTFDEEGNYVLDTQKDEKQIILMESPDTVIVMPITLYFFSVEPMEPIANVKAADETIVVNER